MRSQRVEGMIYAIDRMQIHYAVCKISQVNYEDDTYEYIFEPNYEVIGLLKSDVFQGIPGLNLEIRRDKYIRKNRIPTFIYERTPQENREDLYELLDEYELDFLDPLEWLIRSNLKYTGDNLVVKRYEKPVKAKSINKIPGSLIELESIKLLGQNNYKRLKTILELIAIGSFLYTPDFNIEDMNRDNIHGMVQALYEAEYNARERRQRKGIKNAKDNGKYKGRKRINISIPKLAEVSLMLEKGKISSKEGMEILGLKSRSTFYRRLKEYRENNKETN
ncbi:MAG: hypothetical protein U9N10_02220 [Bacillota bacterium]|nr:hypothetical protein [Bacillota bacterium]